MGSDALVGKTGHVTGRVGPGTVGEIIVDIRGGSEAYFAYPANGVEVILPGKQVVILSVSPPRTVFVSEFSAY